MDLQTFGERCSGVRKLDDDRVRFDCPLDPSHTVVVRRIGDRLLVVCVDGCDRAAVLEALHLSNSDLTISSDSSSNGSIPEPEKPGDAFSVDPGPSVANGVPPAPRSRDFGGWQLEVGYYIKQCFDAVPENQREALATHTDAILIDTVIEKPLGLIRDHQHPLWPLPPGLSETEVEEEIRRLAEKAVSAFKDVYLPGHAAGLPAISNGSVQLPAVGEIDRTPVDAFEAWSAMKADQREYSWEGLVRDGCTMVLTGLMGAGKTTLAMNVARAWATGEPLLGRKCRKSKTLVVVSPKEFESWAECIGFWGLRGAVYLLASHKAYFDSAPEQALWFEQTMKKIGCTTLIADTLFDLYGMPPNARGDSNRIALAEQVPLLDVIRINNWSAIVTGWPPKSEAQAIVARDPEESFGGHTAWSAQHRMRAAIYRKANKERKISSFRTGSGGFGDSGIMKEHVLEFDPDTRLVSLGVAFDEFLGVTALPEMLDALKKFGWMVRTNLEKETQKSASWVKAGLREGLKNDLIKTNGKRGRAVKYALVDEPVDPEQQELLK